MGNSGGGNDFTDAGTWSAHGRRCFSGGINEVVPSEQHKSR